MRRSLLPLTTALVALVGATLPSAATAPPPAHAHIETLSRALSHTALPVGLDELAELAASPCALTMGDEEGAETTSCEEIGQAEEAAPGGPLTLEPVARLNTPSGLMDVVPLPGAPRDAYVTVYGGGQVSAVGSDGSVLWSHSGMDFLKRASDGPVTFMVTPFVLLGVSPVDPMKPAGEDPFVVGDLTGDGVADVAVAHFLMTLASPPGVWKSMVTVIDGATGEVHWSRLYPGHVANLAMVGDRLVVANSTGDYKPEGIGKDGSRSSLEAWRFRTEDGTVVATPEWTHSTDRGWATWLALTPLGDDALAAAWSDAPLGSGAAERGHLLLLDAATGDVRWQAATAGYPRFLRHDPTRDQVVSLEAGDMFTDSAYRLVARDVADGTAKTTIERPDALALSFRVGDVAGGDQSEWVVGDLGLLPNEGACVPDVCFALGQFPVAGRVTALDPATGSALWSQERRGDTPITLEGTALPQSFGLQLARSGGSSTVLVGSFVPGDDNAEIQALDGSTGAVRWSRRGPNLVFPAFLSIHRVDGTDAVLAASSRRGLYGTNVQYAENDVNPVLIQEDTPYDVVRAYAIGDGASVLTSPMLGDIYAVAGARVDGDDVTDLVVGGESGAVFALDGTEIGDPPGILWQRDLGAQVHDVQAADLDGDGRPEIVAAASNRVTVLELATGAIRYSLPYPDDFVWTVAIGDLDANGLPDLVVPGRSLDAYRGSDGTELWSYVPELPGTSYFGHPVIADGDVLSQYLVRVDAPSQYILAVPNNAFPVRVDGRTGAAEWTVRNAGVAAAPIRWKGAAAGAMPGVTGTAAAFSWTPQDPVEGYTLRVDVYDAATGTVAYSGSRPQVSSFGLLPIPGYGVQAHNYSRSLLVGEGGGSDNFIGMYALDMSLLRLPGGDQGIVSSTWPGGTQVFDVAAVEVGSGSPLPLLAAWGDNSIFGASTVQDLDGDPADEIIAHVFDWGAYSGSSVPEGRFSYAQDVVPHSLVILDPRAPGA